jgi:hypothetical protein
LVMRMAEEPDAVGSVRRPLRALDATPAEGENLGETGALNASAAMPGTSCVLNAGSRR